MKKIWAFLFAAVMFLGAKPAYTHADAETVPTVRYTTQIQNQGWLPTVIDGTVSGTTGKNLRMEAIRLSVGNLPAGMSGGIVYSAHVHNIGWQAEVSNSATAGTVQRSLQMEAIKIRLTGDLAAAYDVFYRVHSQNIGWTAWTKDGGVAGSVGMNWRIEAIEVQLVKKGATAPSDAVATDFPALIKPDVRYVVHSQNIGWGCTQENGATAGTINRALRAEAVRMSLSHPTANLTGSIVYQTQVQNRGWMSQVANAGTAGTVGQNLRMESFNVNLTGQMAHYFDVYYQAYVQNRGWMGWAKNGGNAGTEGASLRLEALRVQLVPKLAAAPGSTKNAFIKQTSMVLGVPFISQNANGAPEGCEGASALEILHWKGLAKQYNLTAFLKTMPFAKDTNPNNGFVTSPFYVDRSGVLQSIFPKAFVPWISRFVKTTNISGTNADGFINQISARKPVVVWTTYKFQAPRVKHYAWGTGISNLHVVVIDGYNSTAFHVSDPILGQMWVSKSSLMAGYNVMKYAVALG